MAEIDVLQTGKMLVSSAVHNRDSKSGKFAYTGLFQSKKGRNEVPVKAFLIRINGKNVLVDTVIISGLLFTFQVSLPLLLTTVLQGSLTHSALLQSSLML